MAIIAHVTKGLQKQLPVAEVARRDIMNLACVTLILLRIPFQVFPSNYQEGLQGYSKRVCHVICRLYAYGGIHFP